MKCSSENVTANYVPPPLGNGDFSLQIDMEGFQRQKSYHNMIPCIYRAGRRYDSPGAPLVPFGYFLQNSGAVKQWTQELDVISARIITACEYLDGSRIDTEAFVHLNQPLLAVRKRFSGPYVFRYLLAEPGDKVQPPRRMSFLSEIYGNGVDIRYRLDGMPESHGVISVWCDQPEAVVTVIGNEFQIALNEAGEATFFIAMFDSIDCSDVAAAALKLRRQVDAEGYNGIFASHCAAWATYWAESYVKLPEVEQNLYLTAQYHLRISSTRWSLPVGIFPSHWQGRYFSFDDHFSFMGLITSGHHEMARRIPEFRFKTLSPAQNRAHHYFGQNVSGGRWYWELLEDGTMEGAPGGFWLEHIFHLANIALSSWYYFRFTGDQKFLIDIAYPVMTACADFYQTQSIQEVGNGRYIIGKCTDLERLGPGRENAFMTTCGVIATLEATASAAELLGIDAVATEKRRFLARKLRENLPSTGGRYIPYPGCDQKSIAVFAGTFPYPTLPVEDHRQQAAIDDYLQHEDAYGNMYPVGNSVCTWYAGWKGITFARLGNFAAAMQCIEQCLAESKDNCFSEIFEIGNPPHHPWFTTAEGSYIQLVNETLLQSTEGEIRLPANGRKDYAFKLAAIGGIMVEAEFIDGLVHRLSVTAIVPYQGKIILPEGKCYQLDLPGGTTKVLKA